jgi:hypothetical protein
MVAFICRYGIREKEKRRHSCLVCSAVVQRMSFAIVIGHTVGLRRISLATFHIKMKV